MHHAELIEQVEKQLANPSSQDLRVTTECFSKGSTKEATTPKLDIKMHKKIKVQSKLAQIEDTNAVSNITRLTCGVLDISEQQEQIAMQEKSMPPSGGIPVGPRRTTHQEADNSQAPSGDMKLDAAIHLPSSKSCLTLPIKKTASFLLEMSGNISCSDIAFGK